MFVCLCLDHALTTEHRDTIFGMDTHVAPGSKIGHLRSPEVKNCKLRSLSSNFKNNLHRCIFFFIPYFKCFSYTIDKYIIQTRKQQNRNHKLNMHYLDTHVAPWSKIGYYFDLQGHLRSPEVKNCKLRTLSSNF